MGGGLGFWTEIPVIVRILYHVQNILITGSPLVEWFYTVLLSEMSWFRIPGLHSLLIGWLQTALFLQNSFIKGVGRDFSSADMLRCSESSRHYNNNSFWYGAFASRVSELISENDILSFLATELEIESPVASHITASDIKTVRVMSHWTLLFGIKYEDRGNFLAFYNNSKGIIHKIKRGNW